MFASHKTVLNTQNLNVGLAGWLDLSQNITPPRAPCGANKQKTNPNQMTISTPSMEMDGSYINDSGFGRVSK